MKEFRRELAGFQIEVEEGTNPKKRASKGWNNKVHLDHNRKNCKYKSWHTRKPRKNTHFEPANNSDKLIVKEFKPGLKHGLGDQVIKQLWVLSCII